MPSVVEPAGGVAAENNLKGDSVLSLYPSGKIKLFATVDGEETLVELRCNKDGSIEREKVKGEAGKQ